MDKKVHDLLIIGTGPSAFTAGIYATRDGIDTVLYEKGAFGGLISSIDKIDNYPGFPQGVAGMELAERLQEQAERFGAAVEFGEVTGITDDGDIKTVIVDGEKVQSRAVLISTGSKYNKMGVDKEDEYFGRGVHYCATCDGAFYKDKKLIVVGGGNAGYQEAMFLTRFASHIELIVRSKPRASEVLQEEMKKYVESNKVTIHTNSSVKEILINNNKVAGVVINKKDELLNLESEGIFVFVGLKPNTDFLKNTEIELNAEGYVITNTRYETNIPGVYASGDVREGAIKQVACAVGEGAAAALSIREYLR